MGVVIGIGPVGLKLAGAALAGAGRIFAVEADQSVGCQAWPYGYLNYRNGEIVIRL